MNNYGFFIKKLELTGSNVEPVNIEFEKGLNVIYGSSDTGKTFIFQCINYMLGSSATPKPIPESKNYTLCKLEIKSYKGQTFILKRSLKGGSFNLYNENHTLIETLEIKNNKQSKKNTISNFLLKICNLENKQLVQFKKDNSKRNLYFQDISKYFLINEEKVITEKSIISPMPERNYNPAETFEKNVFRFLLTGIDDNHIVGSVNEDSIEYKKGKVALYGELISQLNEDLKNSEYENIDEQILKLDDGIKNFKEN
jgi:hypothetical protein